MLSGKKIILGICGSIAAYKAAYLVRTLIKSGAEVKVIMTSDATHFISPLTLSTLSKNKVITGITTRSGAEWEDHVGLGLWADAFLIAPATANTIAKMANGICDNMLLATYLSAKCPVFIAPAMDLDMWKHGSTKENIQKLISYGNEIINVDIGELASGLYGEGRMAEPEFIYEFLSGKLGGNGRLDSKKILITAGPTQEAIDPVRYISNHSSGKMGIALANAAAKEGAEVTIVLGPTSEIITNKAIKVINVVSAQDMYEACVKEIGRHDIFIGAAAVADLTPTHPAQEKIKKDKAADKIDLKRTPDILKTLAANKKDGQIMVGFALETEDELKNAKEKLQKKDLDMIILNSAKKEGAGFKTDTNEVIVLDKYNNSQEIKLKAKSAVADDIIDILIKYMNA